MIKLQPILIYALAFLIISLVLKLFGFIYLDNNELLAYTFIFYGISSVYISFGRNKRFQLFIGTTAFLIGVVFFLVSNFDIFNSSSLIFPSVLLILGICCWMLFLDNTDDKAVLFISIIFILLGIIYSFSVGTLRIGSFINSIFSITVKYWMVALITLIIIILLKREDKG